MTLRPKQKSTWRTLMAVGLVLVTMAATSGPALAQDGPIEVFDSNTGYDHVNQPPPGSLSSADWCLSFSDFSLVGQTIEVTATGPSGTVTGIGVVADDGSVRVRVGITEGGSYSITSIRAPDSGRSVESGEVDSVDVVFDPDFVDCADGLSIAPPPTTTGAPTTTLEPTTTTLEPTTTTLEPTTTSTPSTTVSPTAPPSQPASGGGSTGWWVLFGGGIGLLLVGLAMTFFPEVSFATTEKCERERKALAREVGKRKEAQKALDAATAELDAITKESKELSQKSGGSNERVAREKALQSEERRAMIVKNDANRTLITAKGLEKKAKDALEACEARQRSGGPTTPGPATGGDPPGGGTAPPSEDTSKEVEPICCQSGNWFGVNVYTGVMAGIIGWESGIIFMFCADDPSKIGMYTWRGLRLGLGGGAEASGAAVGIYNSDAIHPRQLIIPLRKTLSGVDFDFSVGVGVIKLVKGGVRAVRAGASISTVLSSAKKARSVVNAIKTANKAGKTDEAARLATDNAGLIRDMIGGTKAGQALDSGIKGGTSAGQARGVGLQVPIGVGAQLAVWNLIMVRVECVKWSGCESCDPEKYLPGG